MGINNHSDIMKVRDGIVKAREHIKKVESALQQSHEEILKLTGFWCEMVTRSLNKGIDVLKENNSADICREEQRVNQLLDRISVMAKDGRKFYDSDEMNEIREMRMHTSGRE